MAVFMLGLVSGWFIGAIMIGLDLQRDELSIKNRKRKEARR